MQFGSSTRSYIVTIDYTRMEQAYEKHHRTLEQELEILQRLDEEDLDI